MRAKPAAAKFYTALTEKKLALGLGENVRSNTIRDGAVVNHVD
jgi:hypothetical protein